MEESRNVVITGVGVVCPIGIGHDDFWQSLIQGRSGITPVPMFESAQMPIRIGGMIKGFEGKLFIKPRKSIKVMSPEIQWAVAAAVLAKEHATLEAVSSDRTGVVLGCDYLCCPPEELVDSYRACSEAGQYQGSWGAQAMGKLFPLWMLRNLPNMAACHIGISVDARGPNNTINCGDASGLMAVSEGMELIRRGAADVVFVGGTGTGLVISQVLFRGMESHSRNNENPEDACRPFDANRNGKVGGEGATVLVLESRAHAEQRQAKILAELVCYANGIETRDEQPSGAAIGRCIREVLDKSGIAPTQIDHVNAHGLGTQVDDRLEASSIRETLGDIPVTALKSYFGNMGSGGGVTEMAASVLAFDRGVVPKTLNYETPDPACPVNVICDDQHARTKPAVIKVGQSGTGQTVAVLMKKAE